MFENLSSCFPLLAAGEGIGWLIFLIVLAIFVLPFLIGGLLERALKLKDIGFRTGIVLLTTTLAVTMFLWPELLEPIEAWQYERAVAAYPEAQAKYEQALAEWEKTGKAKGEEEPTEPSPPEKPPERSWQDSIRLGIDLAGGTNMVFQVYSDDPDKPITSGVMDQMVAAVGRRINPSGTEEITVRQVGVDRIEVIIPKADQEDVDAIKGGITRLGTLEFAVLANQIDHRSEIEKAEQLPPEETEVRAGGRVVAAWRPVGLNRDGTQKEVGQGGPNDIPVAVREERERNGEKIREFLVVFEPDARRVTGKYLTRAFETTDQSARPAVGFNFNTRGGFLFQSLTSKYRPRSEGGSQRRLAVLLDGQIHSAPSIRSVIGSSGIIEGSFSPAEIDELIGVLNAGALVVPIKPEPISEFSISPLLGHDVQEKGKQAILWAAVAVLVFMPLYYGFAGLVADLCLVLNLVLIMGAMAFINATFTLPGLAGLVLTIGMAVDANVLIFERIREEQNRGSSLRIAIHNGFSRAFTTIVDANVTTLITAVVLYMIGTDQVRGFAVTLFIGIVMSMFTALYFGRLVFDIVERKRWITRLKMFSIVGHTHWDFVGKKSIAAVCSLALILAGVGGLAVRGEDNLDIDFSGGTMVTFELAQTSGGQTPTIETIRDILKDQPELGSAMSVERLVTQTELQQGTETSTRYRLRTKTQDAQLVQQTINTSLTEAGYPLRLVTMNTFEVQPIAKTPEAADANTEDGETGDEKPADTPAGWQVALAFSDGVKTSTIERLVAERLEEKYEDAGELLTVEGTERDPDDDSAYAAMLLKVQPEVAEEDLQTALGAVRTAMANDPIFEEVNTFASSVAAEMQQSAVLAMLFSMLAIVGYLWFRFQRVTFGLAAIAAVLHDVFVVLGMVALGSLLFNTPLGPLLGLEDFKINLPMVAAFLTIVGYSLNDTIVVFDRVREVRGKNPALTEEMVNRSLNQTLARTLLTSLTTLIVVIILYARGGEGIHGFAYCLVVGVVVGTYSSIYVASPVLVWLMNRPSPASERVGATSRATAAT